MRIDIHEEKKVVCIWLSRAESADAGIRETLKPLFQEYKSRNYTVALYHSGGQPLPEATGALLVYNRRLFAQRELRAEQERSALTAQ